MIRWCPHGAAGRSSNMTREGAAPEDAPPVPDHPTPAPDTDTATATGRGGARPAPQLHAHEEDDHGPVSDAEAEALTGSSPEHPTGRLGPPLNRRSPFVIGLMAAAGVAVTYGFVLVLSSMRSELVLIGSALFIAMGLQPVVAWLERCHLRRGLAVTVVFGFFLALVVGFLAAAIPPIATQATQLTTEIPTYLAQLQNKSSLLGRLNAQYGIETKVMSAVSGPSVLGNVVGIGKALFGYLTNLVLLIVLTAYFLVDLPRVRRLTYRLLPASRRPRAVLLGDQILAKVGAYVLGNVIISIVTAVSTYIWLVIFGVPYPLLLAVFVALLDLIPVVGSTIAGVIVCAVALTVSIPVAIYTAGFFLAQRLLEDYLLVPRIIGRVVRVPGVITVVAVILGAAVLGLVGALIAIPVAAAVQLIIEEIVIPRMDEE